MHVLLVLTSLLAAAVVSASPVSLPPWGTSFDKTNTISKCKLYSNYIETWNWRYDACAVVYFIKQKCDSGDSRWAYDALWDSRNAIGCYCGESQTYYRGNSWETFCSKIQGVMDSVGDSGTLAGYQYNPVEYCVQMGCDRRYV
ncbi:hypothetical protein HDU96_000977 [Phlyctochytrium bullatum]|nr:hypothetical protein HDU96_000977 [Phlyctochytrium bullatum]